MPKLTITKEFDDWYYECRYGEVPNKRNAIVVEVSEAILDQIKTETYQNVELILQYLYETNKPNEEE